MARILVDHAAMDDVIADLTIVEHKQFVLRRTVETIAGDALCEIQPKLIPALPSGDALLGKSLVGHGGPLFLLLARPPRSRTELASAIETRDGGLLRKEDPCRDRAVVRHRHEPRPRS